MKVLVSYNEGFARLLHHRHRLLLRTTARDASASKRTTTFCELFEDDERALALVGYPGHAGEHHETREMEWTFAAYAQRRQKTDEIETA